MAKLTREEDQLALDLRGHPDFQGALAAVKAVPGRRYDPENKRWVFPAEPGVAERLLVTVKPEVDAATLAWIKTKKSEAASELITPLPEDSDTLVPWGRSRVHWQPEFVGSREDPIEFKGLFPFQRSFVAHQAAAVLLADDMGLGKCGQASSRVVEHLLSQSAYAANIDMPLEAFDHAGDMLAWAGIQDGPKIVVSPNSVKGTWARELRMWLGRDIPLQIVDATTAKARNKQLREAIDGNAWSIVNWEQIRVKRTTERRRKKIMDPWTHQFIGWKNVDVDVEVMREPLFESTNWVAAIADEAHRAKNRKSLQTKGLWKIGAQLKMALTVTPLMNSPDELWAILHWLFPEEYTSYWRFFDQYVDHYEGQYGKIITGVKNVDALRFELGGRLVRRTKREVLDLPDKVRQFVPVQMGKKQRKLYEEAETQMWFEVEQAIKEGDKEAAKFAQVAAEGGNLYQVVNGAARTVRLRQIASTPALLGGEDNSAKLDAAVEIILDAQPKQFGVFTEFVGTAHILVERLRAKGVRAEAWVGGRSTAERTLLEDRFQNGEVDVVVGTIPAMKEGVTLTAADTAIFVERGWTPATNEQCEDRFHRQGQTKKVTIIILEAEDSVDTGNVHVKNVIKSMIVESVIQKDYVEETREEPQDA